jgi:putative ATP-dependent endonuclease of OLD family
MKIRKLIIKNFRGIKDLDWSLPAGNIFCLIGKGDSSKSTILDGIRYAFHPQWNLLLTDSDFYQCTTDKPIVIEVTIGELIDEFCSLNKYGQYLRGWDTTNLILSDEPDDHLEKILTVRLTIEKDLEPKWRAVCDRNPDGVEFRAADRIKVSVGIIGAYSERQLSWANGTALAKLTDDPNLNESLANASRTARNSVDDNRAVALKNFDEAAQKSQVVAKLLGVPVINEYKAHLDLNSINIKIAGLTLHDGDMPMRLLGLGSRRMLLCGIQQTGLQDGHITLFDEVEFGLEPHRIARLIKHVSEDKTGQYFLTTHSPNVLKELTVKELHIVHNKSGVVQIIAALDKSLEEHEVQGKIRSSAEAFLAKKVVACEGATEVGFLRGFDDYQLGVGKDPLSYLGVALLDVRGVGNIKGMAQAFKSLHYRVAVLADGDAPKQFSDEDAESLVKQDIAVQIWSDNLCLEERAMMDLPWASVLVSVKLAQDELNFLAYDQVRSKLEEELDKNIDNWVDSPKIRLAIGKAANGGKWFKDITRGELWFKAIAPAFSNSGFLKTDLAVKLDKLWTWAEDA